MTYNFSDNIIAHIAQLVQLGMLTGTDVVDHMRMIRVTANNEDKLDLDPEYMVEHENRIQKLVADAETMSAQAQKEESGLVQ